MQVPGQCRYQASAGARSVQVGSSKINAVGGRGRVSVSGSGGNILMTPALAINSSLKLREKSNLINLFSNWIEFDKKLAFNYL